MSRDLEEFLRHYTGPIVINLWESDCHSSRDMEQHMQAFERLKGIPVLRLSLTTYRDWAQRHGIYGTPALIVYASGRPLFRTFGRTTASRLLQRLQEYGL